MHLEDEWEQWIGLPEALFLEVMQSLPIEATKEISFDEFDKPDEPYCYRFDMSLAPDDFVFSYRFIANLDNFAKVEFSEDNIAIVDIMRFNELGEPAEGAALAKSILDEAGIVPANQRYFSAFPAFLPVGLGLLGFDKERDDELLNFLREKILA